MDEQKQPQQPEPARLIAQHAVMTAQVQIVRAGTGKVEDYTLTFTPGSEEPQQEKEA
jgi:hypothetical protein